MTRRRRAVAALVPLGLLVLAGQVRAAGPPTARYSHDPEALVIRLQYGFGEVEGVPSTVVEVWGDGRIAVHRPDFGHGASVVDTRVPAAEVQRLVDTLVGHGVLDYDHATVVAEMDAIRQERERRAEESSEPVFIGRRYSDPAPMRLELHVSEYLPEGPSGPVREDVSAVIEWEDLRSAAASYPEIPALRGVVESRALVKALQRRPDLAIPSAP